ncbi:hypothetical protein CRX42_01100 [Pseudomonas jessenii]|uniref:Methylamine utilization protein MauE n=1 Tax=Pseudomonas jessenii TaxID=77298 RepID=A0A2W0EVL8_PSEJE|nr:MauE/DoxX family redox-associated membrane protein [Pseudomonas jessenii]PYY72473.1 hypothetical protein CRX42_01100 [Pseudomonas jessenii]
MMDFLHALDAAMVIAIRIFIGLMFAHAVIGKVRNRELFIAVLANYRLVPKFAVPMTAWFVLLLEAGIVLMMPFDVTVQIAGGMAGALLGVFTIAIAVNLARGRSDIDCGCFQGEARHHLSVSLVARNLLLSAMCLLLAYAYTENISLMQLFSGLCAGGAMFIIYQVAGQLFALAEKSESFHRKVS